MVATSGTQLPSRARAAVTVAVAVCFAAALCLIARRDPHQEPEPFYGGAPLSKWLDDFLLDKPVEGHEKAAEAVRRIGTNALRLLLKRLTYKDNLLEKVIYSKLGRQDVPHDVRIRQSAVSGFQALASSAAPAIPELQRLLSIEPYSALALGAIGAQTLPILASELTNCNPEMRAYAIAGLRLLGGAGEATAPGVILLTHDKDYRVRLSGVLMLGDCTRSKAATYALIQRLDDSDHMIRARAAEALGKYGRHAIEAIPPLENKIGDTSPYVVSEVRKALQEIRADLSSSSGDLRRKGVKNDP